MNIAGPVAGLIFGVTVLTVVVGLLAYTIYKVREQLRKKAVKARPAGSFDLEYFTEFALPADAQSAETPASKPSRGRLRLVLGIAAGVVIASGIPGVLWYQGRRLPITITGPHSAASLTGPTLDNVPRGAMPLLAHLPSRRASPFVGPSYDTNHDGAIQEGERARIHAEIPQFIVLSCDDNGSVEGLDWLDHTLKEHGIRGKTTFFMTANYLRGRPAYLGGPIEEYWQLEASENYVGLHGTTHADGTDGWSFARWTDENRTSQESIAKNLRPPEGWSWAAYPWGSRAPYLQLTDTYFESLEKLEPKVLYDSSLVVRPAPNANNAIEVRDLPWPFSLDGDLPAELERPYLLTTNTRATIGSHRLWEIPVYAWLVETGGTATPWQPSLDFNLWKFYPCTTPGPNVAALEVLEKNLRAHYRGNRAPFALGMHAQNYTSGKICERATFAAFLDRVDRLIEEGLNLRYTSMPDLVVWVDRKAHE